jgi:S1-C subfamily serine protease
MHVLPFSHLLPGPFSSHEGRHNGVSSFPPPTPLETPAAAPSSQHVRRRWILASIIVVATVIGGFFGAQIAQEATDSGVTEPGATASPEVTAGTEQADAPGRSQQPVQTAPVGTGRDLSVAQVVDRITPSVVTVLSSIDDGMNSGSGTGTGVIVTSDGEILTNAHVVDDATSVRVLLDGAIDPIEARVLALDMGNDLALLKVDRTGLKPAVFATPESIRIGDEVVAIGFALNLDGGPTVTRGIVSALNRTLVNEDGALDGLIQTDAAISSGNSGGPLLNIRAQIIGINTAVFQSSGVVAANNVGFAISVSEVLPVIQELRAVADGEPRIEGYLGVELVPRSDGGRGAVINLVTPGSPAAAAGIRAGDIVIAADRSPVDGQAAFVAAIRDKSPGDSIDIVVLRDGQRLTLTAILAERPSP